MSVSSVSEKFVGILRQDTALQDKVAALFVEARDDVYRYLLTLGLHPPRAQEAVQEVFLRLYATMKKGEKIENPRGWIFRVAHNYGLKVRERQASETHFDPELESRLTASGERPRARTAGPRAHAAVSQCDLGLSEQQKRCLFLRMEGLRIRKSGRLWGSVPRRWESSCGGRSPG